MHPFIIIIAILAVVFFLSWVKKAPKAKQKQLRNRGLLIGGGAILLIGLLSGRLHPLLAAVGAAVPLVFRVLGVLQQAHAAHRVFGGGRGGSGFGGFGGSSPAPGQSSKVETRYLEVSLDHDTGEMEGKVLEGQFAGRALSDLSRDQLIALYRECASADKQSGAVLEAYLDRSHDDWREEAGAQPGAAARPDTDMNDKEAAEILGVTADATRDEIVGAHRRLMQKLHPDRGGSDYLASKINKAKAVLLGES